MAGLGLLCGPAWEALPDAEQKQMIGNKLYPSVAKLHPEFASKITGMLLDNEQVVDPLKLVTDMNYLQTKAHEAYTLLQENMLAQQQ